MKWYAFAILSLAACGGAGQEPQAPTVAEQAQHVASAHTFYGGYEAIGATGEGYWGLYGKGTVGQGVVGKGGPGVAGGYFEAGTLSTAAARYAALQVVGGDISLSTPAPVHSAPVVNAVTPTSMAKAWARIETVGRGSPTVTVHGGLNVSEVRSKAFGIDLFLAAPVQQGCAAFVTTGDRALLCQARCDGAKVAIVCGNVDHGLPLTNYDFLNDFPANMQVVVYGAQ